MKNTTYLILAFLVCQLSFSKVTVDPVMPALPNMIVCDDNNDGMALFNLSSQDAYIISGQSSMPSSYIVTYHLTLLDANNGTSAIASPASYLGSNGQVIYARIINIATGFFAVGPFSLIVNPKPIISNKSVSICSGSTFNVTPTNTVPDIVPAGTTYTWIAAPTSGITGSSNQAIGLTSISQTLTNTTSSILNVVYNVTATSPSGCSSTFIITVSVVVAPIISSKSISICSGSTFNVNPATIPPDYVPTGTTYIWTSPVISPAGSITGGSANFTDQTSINQTLTNPTSASATATYIVTATGPSGCSSSFTITVLIIANPVISNKAVSICSGDTFNITPTNTLPDVVPTGITYTWTVEPLIAIIGSSNQSVPQTSISQTLTNSSNFVQNVVYHVTATSNSCSSTFTITVTVNPKPSISSKSVTICSGGTFYVTPTNTLPDVVPVGTTYAWSAPVYSSTNISDGSAQTAPSIFGQTLTNSGNTVETATYTVTAISNAAPNSCSSVFTITVIIKPTVSVTVPSNISICNGSYVPASVFSSNLPGTTYTWTNSNPAIGISSSGTGNIPSFLGLNPLNAPISSTITVAPFNNGCLGTPSSYTITVLPSVNLPVFPNVTACSSYTLPPLSVGNYFTGPNATGVQLFPGDIITSIGSNVIYVYDSNSICFLESSFVVTIYPAANPVIISNTGLNELYVDYATSTVAQPLLLTATIDSPTDYSYQWYLNGIAIAGATNLTLLVDSFAISDAPRNFIVIVSSFFGCIGTSSFEVIQVPVPAPSGLTSQTFTPGQTLADLVVTGTNVLWYSSLTGRNTTSTPLPSNTLLVDGVTYYATQTINGYESPNRLAVTVHSTLSNDSFGIVDFKYSPNPVNDYLFIQAKETIKTVTVYNALGQLVLSQNGNTMELKLDLSQLKSGNYFVKIQSDLKQNSFKIIKK